jgi:hypothetical protein
LKSRSRRPTSRKRGSQSKWARAFIEDNLKPTENCKRLLQAVERVASLAHDKALIDVFARYALDPLETVPADRIAIEEFQAKRWPQITATAQDLKQEHAARHARQQAAKAPEA